MDDELQTRVRQLAEQVCEEPLVEPASWTADGRLTDYGFGSLDLVHLVMRVEEEFGLGLEPEDMNSQDFASLGSIEALVRRRMA